MVSLRSPSNSVSNCLFASSPGNLALSSVSLSLSHKHQEMLLWLSAYMYPESFIPSTTLSPYYVQAILVIWVTSVSRTLQFLSLWIFLSRTRESQWTKHTKYIHFLSCSLSAMGKEKGEKGSEAKECAIVGHDEIVNGTVTVRLIENKASKKARGGGMW